MFISVHLILQDRWSDWCGDLWYPAHVTVLVLFFLSCRTDPRKSKGTGLPGTKKLFRFWCLVKNWFREVAVEDSISEINSVLHLFCAQSFITSDGFPWFFKVIMYSLSGPVSLDMLQSATAFWHNILRCVYVTHNKLPTRQRAWSLENCPPFLFSVGTLAGCQIIWVYDVTPLKLRGYYKTVT